MITILTWLPLSDLGFYAFRLTQKPTKDRTKAVDFCFFVKPNQSCRILFFFSYLVFRHAAHMTPCKAGPFHSAANFKAVAVHARPPPFLSFLPPPPPFLSLPRPSLAAPTGERRRPSAGLHRPFAGIKHSSGMNAFSSSIPFLLSKLSTQNPPQTLMRAICIRI